MLSPGLLYLLGVSPSITPQSTKIFLRILSEYDLRKPIVISPVTLEGMAKAWGIPRWQLDRAFRELEEGGVMEELDELKYSLLANTRVMRLRRILWLGREDEERFRKESEEIRERLKLELTRAFPNRGVTSSGSAVVRARGLEELKKEMTKSAEEGLL